MPGFGVISEVISKYSKRVIFGREGMIPAMFKAKIRSSSNANIYSFVLFLYLILLAINFYSWLGCE